MQHFLDPGPIIALTCHSFILSVSNAFANQVDVCKIFVKGVSGICQSYYIDCMDLSMLFNGFVKFSRVFLPNQTKLKFDQDSKLLKDKLVLFI